jgi:hypothetical protein
MDLQEANNYFFAGFAVFCFCLGQKMGAATFVRMAFDKMTLSMEAKLCSAEFPTLASNLIAIMLDVVVLKIIMKMSLQSVSVLNIIMLSVIMLSVIMLSAIMLSVIMLGVIMPRCSV